MFVMPLFAKINHRIAKERLPDGISADAPS
jgi:hypothetical protein